MTAHTDTKDSCCYGPGRLPTAAHHLGRIHFLRLAAPEESDAGHDRPAQFTAGLRGTITAISDDTVDLEIAPGVNTTWMKLAVRDRIVDDVDEDTDFDEDTNEDAYAPESTATEVTESPNKKTDS